MALVVPKGQSNQTGSILRTDFGLGGESIASIKQTRNWALEYRRLAKPGLNPCFNAKGDTPIFEEFAEQVHIDWMLMWKSDGRSAVDQNLCD